MRWLIVFGALSAVALMLVFSLQNRQPDVRAASVRKLVEIMVGDEPGSDAGALRGAANRELSSRPPESVLPELRVLLGDPTAAVRGAAAGLVGTLIADLLPSAHREYLGELLTLLEDPVESVRTATVAVLGLYWRAPRPTPLPREVLVTIGDLLRSGDPESRIGGALAAVWLGPAAQELATALVNRLESEEDAAVRLMIVSAIGGVGAKDAAAVAAVSRCLYDPDENVQASAATALGLMGRAAGSAASRLRELAADEAVAEDLRRSALAALAEVVGEGEAAGDVLALYSRSRVLFEFAEEDWVATIGDLASRAPKSPALARARDLLVATLDEEDHELALIAASSLAKITCATSGPRLHPRAKELLADTLGGLADRIESDPRRHAFAADAWSAVQYTRGPVVEALVVLSHTSLLVVDVAELRRLLELLQEHQSWWVREWAGEQLQRLQ